MIALRYNFVKNPRIQALPMQVSKVHVLAGHRDCVYTLEASEQPHTFFSAAGDGMVVRWDLRQPEEGQLIARLPTSVYALHYVPGTKLLIAGQNYEGIHVLDYETPREQASLKLTGAAIFDIKSRKNHIWIACGDGSVVIVDWVHWNILHRIQVSDKSARCLAIHPHTGEVAVGYSDCYIRIFDGDSFELKHEWIAHQNSVFSVSFDPAGKRLLSTSRDARIKSWPWPQVEPPVEVVAHLFAVNHLAWSDDQTHFATGSMDKSVKIWRADEMKLVKVIDKARHAGHGTSVNKLLWTSFNHWLVAASDDRTISVWQIESDK
jgi:WD40 repeat protein